MPQLKHINRGLSRAIALTLCLILGVQRYTRRSGHVCAFGIIIFYKKNHAYALKSLEEKPST